MSKRKIVALILFVFISLFMFSFATPRGIGIKKNNNVPEKETFTVVFKNYDGTILDEQTIEKGNSASYQGETPKRPNSKICNYEFTGWSDSIQNVTSNIDVVAQYNCEKRSYVVRFMDDDKVTLLATDKVNAGGTAIYSGKTPTKINHVFNGWNDTLSNILSNKTVYATYYADYNHNDIDDAKEDHYNITFKAGENGSLEGTTTYTNILTGLTFEQANIIIPTPVPNKNYKFKEWTPKINKTVSASVEYTAEFYPDFNNNNIDDREEEHYTIEFLAGEHGILEGTTTYENILTGLTFEQANIVIPKVKANENYKANGWDKEINTTVTEDATYTAQYFADFNNNDIDDETERVTVIFYAGEHGIIGNSKEYMVEGLLPGYDNYPDAPNIDVYFGYGFKAWNPNYNANTMIPLENASLEFTATYFEDKNHNGIDDETEDHYTVKFNAGLHGTLEGQTTYENILTGLTFSEAGIVIPTINANENYKANGWDKEINTTVIENATYTAQYFADFNNNGIDDESEKVTITFVPGEHGNFAENSQTSYVLLPGYDNYPEAPEVIANNKYEHTGWTPTLPLGQIAITVNSDITYTATYTKTTADITVNVTSNITRNGTAVAGSIVEYGDKINYTITIKNNDTVDGSVNLKNIINGNLDTTDLPEEYKALLTNEGYTVNVTANNTVTIEFSLTVKANVNETVRVDLTYSVDGNGTNTIEGTEYNTEKTITIIEKTETVNGTNIVIVIDRSASMDGNRIEKAKEATNSFIDKVFTKNSNTHGSTVTVVTFGTNAKWVGGLLFGGYEHTPYANQIGITATDYNTAQNLKKAVNELSNYVGNSGTPYYKGLEKAYGILYDETTGLSTNGNQNAVIFLSDGAPDDNDNVTSRKNIINNLKDKNTIMYTIGFGVTKDSDAHKVLKNVAYDNADNTYLAKDDGTNDLVNVFSAISSKIADKNKSKQTTKGVAEIGQTVVADATHQIIVKVNGTETYKFNSLEEALASGVITSNTTGYKVNATKFQAGDKIEVSYYASIS